MAVEVSFSRFLEIAITTKSRLIRINHLYMNFNIHRSVSDEDVTPSTFEIYNAHRDLINEIIVQDTVSIEAGYEGQTGNIFKGIITDKMRDRRREDRVITLEISEQPASGLNISEDVIVIEFKDSVPLSVVINRIADALGVMTDASISVFDGKKTLSTGSSYVGTPGQLILEICNPLDISYFVEAGVLQFREAGKPTTSSAGLGGIIINRDTPIVGDPEVVSRKEDDLETAENVSLEAQLSAVYEPGRLITIDRNLLEETHFSKEGDFVIIKANHVGDNLGGKFSTMLTLERRT